MVPTLEGLPVRYGESGDSTGDRVATPLEGDPGAACADKPDLVLLKIKWCSFICVLPGISAGMLLVEDAGFSYAGGPAEVVLEEYGMPFMFVEKSFSGLASSCGPCVSPDAAASLTRRCEASAGSVEGTAKLEVSV